MNAVPETLQGLRVAVDGLRAYGKNPRLGNVDAIVESLLVNGQYRPIVVRAGTNEVLAGNHTLAAARQLGWEQIAATFVDCDEDQAARIVLVDNRTNDLASNEDRLLAEVLSSLPTLDGTGYDDEELAQLLASVADADSEGLVDADEVAPLPAQPRTRAGDVWQLGAHRLACSDATDAGAWAAMFDDARLVDAVWTDPPYGVDYEGKTAEALKIRNDSHGVGAVEELLRAVFTHCLAYCKPGAAWYVAAPVGPASLAFSQVLTELNVWRQTLAWVKHAFALGHSDYHYRHEAVYFGYGPPGQGRHGRGGAGWYGPHNADSVFEVDKPARSTEHPTMKPVELIVQTLHNSTAPHQLVVDPFAGSGATLIACERTGRVARLLELDPRYADVICRRFQQFTGHHPVLEETGEQVDFLGDDVADDDERVSS